MGIKRLEWCLNKDCKGGFSEVNIRDMVSRAVTRKVMVVDGNQFYERYLYNRFQWIYGGIVEYVQEVRTFVEKFEAIGLKLVFFFDTVDTVPTKRALWIERRKGNIKFSKEVINALRRGEYPPQRDFKDRPLNVKFLTIHFLREVMQCEVHCSDNKIKRSAIYAAEQNCFAILSQNSYYVFHPDVPAYLSLKALNMEEMTTIQYNIDAFWKHVQLEQIFFPLLATIVGDNSLKDTKHPIEVARENIKKIVYQKINESRKTCYFVCISKFIHNHFEGHNMENVPKFLTEQFGADGQKLTSSYFEFKEMFSLQKLQPSNPSTSWEMILEQAQRLYSSGEICSEIYNVLHHNIYEHHTILENFEGHLGSGETYRLLRQQLYCILLYEAPQNSLHTITEWCVSDDATSLTPLEVVVVPATINLHPGLLTLWDTNNMSHDLQSKKWKMFVDGFAPTHTNLDYDFFCNLPRNLVVPVAVLFYLQHEVPKTFLCGKILKPWEVEVFIAIGMILSKKEKDVSRIKISPGTTNVRAVQLSALFMCGCQTLQLLVQACGLEKVIDSQIYYYFDGKLFHNLCEKAKWNCGTWNWHSFLESDVMFDTFQKIKQKIL